MRLRLLFLLAGLLFVSAETFAQSITWSGTNGNTWDNGTTFNWNTGGASTNFSALDNVVFDDSAANGSVTLSGSMAPGSVVVNNNTTAYTFAGTGQIGGATGLLKSGTGTLTISNTNSYTGGTTISAGTIIINNANALSTSGTITLGDVNTGANNASLLIDPSAGAVTFSRPLVVSSSVGGAATIGRTGTDAGQVTISSTIRLNGSTTFQSSSSGALNLTGNFIGSGDAIFTGGGVTNLSATTSGSGASNWTGGVSVKGNSAVVTGTSSTANLLTSGSRTLSVEAGSGVALARSGTLAALTGTGSVGATTGTTVTLTVGAGNANSTFAGTVGGATVAGYAISSSVNLVKSGSGTLTMTGNNTYTGSTTISQGKLALAGSGALSNTPSISITPGAVLDVSGLSSGTFVLGGGQTLVAGRTTAFANDVVGNLASSGTLNVAGSSTAGTLMVSGNLSLSGGSLLYDLANATTSGSHVNDLISIGGNISLSGTTLVSANLINGSLATGTYTLVSGAGISSGNSSNLVWSGSLSRQSVSFDTTTTPGTIYMTVAGVGAQLIWSGTNGSVWDTDTTTNWKNGGAADKFLAGDFVTFDDSSSNGTVNLTGTLQPGSIKVNNNTTAYAFGGTGQIAGTAGLLKSGTGMLIVSATNTYTGGTVISAGTVVAANANALSSGTVTLGDVNTGANNVALLVSSSTNGTVTYANAIAVSSSGSGAAIIGRTGTASGAVTIGSAIALNRDTTFQSSPTGTLNLTGSFSGNGNANFTGGGVTTVTTTSGSSFNWTGGVSVTGSSMVVTGSNVTGINVIASGTRNVNIEAGSGLALSNSGTFKSLTGGGVLGANTGTVNVTVGVGNASSTFDGVIGSGTVAGYAIGGGVNLIKTGSGSVTLTGNNTYTGSTTVAQGKLALSGGAGIANSPSITINSGAVLDVSGLGSGLFTNLGGQTLTAGKAVGSANDVIGNLANAGTINIAGSGTAGTLTISGNLGLTGGILKYDFSNAATAGSGVNDLISVGGSLSLSGTTTIAPTLLAGTLATGTYTLVSGGTTITAGSGSNLVWGGVLSRQSVTFDTTTTPGAIYMMVAGAAGNLIWTGSNGSAWDTNGTANWNNVGSADKFLSGDNVTFDDTSANGTVNLSGTVQPGSITINNNTTAYSIGGGAIAGNAGLLKSGTGTLTFSATNNSTGNTVISAGKLTLDHPAAWTSSGTIALGDNNTGTNTTALLISSSTGATTFSHSITVGGSGTGTAIIGRSGTATGPVTVNSKFALNRDTTFQSSPTGMLGISGTFAGTGNASFNGGGVTTLTAVSGSSANWTGGISVKGNSVVTTGSGSTFSEVLVNGNRSLDIEAGSGVAIFTDGTYSTLTGGGNIGSVGPAKPNVAVGAMNASSTFDGNIGGNTIAGYSIGNSANLVKIGTGTFTLTGANTYTGSTTVSQGKLALTGAAALTNTGSINVNSGAVLDVSGLASGTFGLKSSQTLTAGRTTGFANDVIGNVSSSGTINVANVGTAGTMTVSGNLGLGGGTLLFDIANVTTAGSHVNDLISIGGSVSLSGSTVVTPNFLNNAIATGTYTLISGGSGIAAGSGSNLVWGGPAIRQDITFDTTSNPGSVYMVVSGNSANLVWSGSSGGVWDSNSNTWSNVSSSGTSDKFYGLDNVVFNDSASTGNVVLSGTLLPGSVTVNNNTVNYNISGTGQIVGGATLVKSGTGTLTVSGSQAYTGATTVNNGSLVVNGSIASSGTVTVSAGASIGGHGSVGAITGSGVVAPGDPTILTATQVDPSSGLAFNFQFGQAGSPIYSNAAASGNDVLHLTDSTPFKFSLTSANTVTLDFTGLTLTQGEVFYGGFFTDAAISDSTIDGAKFVYVGLNGAIIQYDGLVAVPSADFADGTVVNGEIMKFSVTAVPEPNTYLLFGAGLLAAVAWRNRKRFSIKGLK